jgi:hypothetical protein
MICLKCNNFILYAEKSLGERNYCIKLNRTVSEITSCSAYNDKAAEIAEIKVEDKKQVIEPDNIITKIKKLWQQFKIFVIGR